MTTSRGNSTINRFVDLFQTAFAGLGRNVSMGDIEVLAMLVHNSMDGGRRRYHRSPHVLDVCRDMNPLQILGGLFHDTVYYQLDEGLPRKVAPMLDPLLEVHDNTVSLLASALKDPAIAMVATLFRALPGQKLDPMKGMNEFLSALVAVKALEPLLPGKELLAIATIIEATVPFRPQPKNEAELYGGMPARLTEAAHAAGIELTRAEFDRVIGDAVLFANRDVSSFREPDPGRFLASTWLLIEESNAPLAAVGRYSVQEYRGALMRMQGFLRSLDPGNVFHRYGDTPSAEEFAELHTAAVRNIAFACEYIDVKILGIGIVEALAMATGADCPISMLLGDIRIPDGHPEQIGDFLPHAKDAENLDRELLRVLEEGRAWASEADLNTSPLSAFLYRGLGEERTTAALACARRFIEGSLPAVDFLRSIDPDVMVPIIEACTHITISRRQELTELARSLRS